MTKKSMYNTIRPAADQLAKFLWKHRDLWRGFRLPSEVAKNVTVFLNEIEFSDPILFDTLTATGFVFPGTTRLHPGVWLDVVARMEKSKVRFLNKESDEPWKRSSIFHPERINGKLVVSDHWLFYKKVKILKNALSILDNIMGKTKYALNVGVKPKIEYHLSQHDIIVPPFWRSRVYDKGLAILDGKFIFDAAPVQGHTGVYAVTYMQVGRNPKLKVRQGVAMVQYGHSVIGKDLPEAVRRMRERHEPLLASVG